MLDGTYNGLVASVQDWLMRPDLAASIPDLIISAEDTLSSREEISFEKDDDFVITTSPQNLPADCREVQMMYYESPAYYEIDFVDEGLLALRTGAPNTAPGQLGGTLEYPQRPIYAAVGANAATVKFAPVPDQAYPAKIKYVTKLVRSTQGKENWLLTGMPSVYLYATLVESAPFLKNDERLQTWGTLLEQKIKELRGMQKRRQFVGTQVWKPRRAIG